MGARYQIVEATQEHAAELAPRMRAEDALEVRASGGYSPLEALSAALDASSYARTALLWGRVAAMYGVAPLPRSGAVAWLLTSDLVSTYPIPFIRACKAVLPELLERFPVLVNAIDARYETALRWAERLGFEVYEPVPFGVNGEPFCPIGIRRKGGSLCASPRP